MTSGGILRHQHRRGERGAGPHRAVRQRGAQDLREHRAAGRKTGGAAVDTFVENSKYFSTFNLARRGLQEVHLPPRGEGLHGAGGRLHQGGRHGRLLHLRPNIPGREF